ncbi:MAG TPA: metallophosphoesterase [Ignavibacteria bacterium]|nr:metallophosphoesterase [Ignavibacteria bacterium]
MKKILLQLLLVVSITDLSHSQLQTFFSAIGDYGLSGTNELRVANFVKSVNPDFIITLGDNNYDLGEASTIDPNIGQYYHQYIHPYTGSYGAGSAFNRFFPSMGNHDWYTASGAAYLNYFTLPGNERYYDFVKGNVHFFVLDSDPNEPDGIDSSSVQAQWLKQKLSESSETFNIVYFHHPPYSSGPHGSDINLQWPFRKWGATTVLCGHDHTYERLFVDSLTYFVNGLGGHSLYSLNAPVPGSLVRYNSNYGAMFIYSFSDSIVFTFYNIALTQIDYFTIFPAVKKLYLNSLIEGFYNQDENAMISDTVKVLLRNFTSPYLVADSSKGYLNSDGSVLLNFSKARNATDYYIVLKHRNSIETWSNSGYQFILNSLNYDFTGSSASAYGNNLVMKGNKYCIYSGDVNQDGLVESFDVSSVENAVSNSLTGYLNTDLNGDEFSDAADLSIVDNNKTNSVAVIAP